MQINTNNKICKFNKNIYYKNVYLLIFCFMKIFEEFKAFAMKWNVVDMAVWVVIGTAFWKIVSSLVSDVITPSVWILVWWVDFTKWGYSMKSPVTWTEVLIAYWKFLQTLFDFVIIAFSIYLVIKIMTKSWEKVIKKWKKEEVIKKPDDILLLEEIRDLLKKGK